MKFHGVSIKTKRVIRIFLKVWVIFHPRRTAKVKCIEECQNISTSAGEKFSVFSSGAVLYFVGVGVHQISSG